MFTQTVQFVHTNNSVLTAPLRRNRIEKAELVFMKEKNPKLAAVLYMCQPATKQFSTLNKKCTSFVLEEHEVLPKIKI